MKFHFKVYNLLTTLKVLSALLGVYVFFNTKGSRIARILLCLKYDLQPELGSGLPSRWWLRPTLPGSRVTKKENKGWPPSQKGVRKKTFKTLYCVILVLLIFVLDTLANQNLIVYKNCYTCCAFQPAFGCCALPKSDQTTFFSRYQPFFVHFKPFQC